MAKLRKELSLFQATLYGIGIILGAGIYVLIGQGAALSGEHLWLSFTIAAIIATFTGLSYAELSSMFPKTAAEYVYVKKAFNKRSLAFLVQWIMVFALIVSASTVAIGFGGYFYALFGIEPLFAAAALIVIVSIVNYTGIKESSKFNILATFIEMAGLFLVIGIGAFFVGNTDIDFIPKSFEFAGILSATALIFFAYIGFEDLVNLSEETKNAKKIVPKALVISLIITTVLYILVSISAVAVAGVDVLATSSAPLTDVVSTALPGSGFVMSLIALFSTANTALAFLIVASRMLYGLSKNSELPSIIGKIGKRQTPYTSVFIVMLFSLLALLLGGIKIVALLADISIFVVYLFINGSLIALRYKLPKTRREFRSPINIGRFPVLALLGIVTSGLMLLNFEPSIMLFELAVVIVGYIIYRIVNPNRKSKAVSQRLRKPAF